MQKEVVHDLGTHCVSGVSGEGKWKSGMPCRGFWESAKVRAVYLGCKIFKSFNRLRKWPKAFPGVPAMELLDKLFLFWGGCCSQKAQGNQISARSVEGQHGNGHLGRWGWGIRILCTNTFGSLNGQDSILWDGPPWLDPLLLLDSHFSEC